MSTPDQPEATPLTRRRLREIRATGATPIITPDEAAADAASIAGSASTQAPETEAPTPDSAVPDTAADTAAADSSAVEPEPEPEPAAQPEPAAPLPRAAAPVAIPPAMTEADVDLGVSPLTRRQARAQERIRTASVPIIQPDAPAAEQPITKAPEPEPAAETPEPVAHEAPVEADPAASDHVLAELAPAADDAEEETPVPAEVNPDLGSGLLAGETPKVTIPPSFDQLIARSSSATGSVATPNALILSQTPSAAPLGPITATGEVLITGSFDLPAGLGSVGHAEGAADGKELDAALIDGELPPQSSPTPIAASAAISTARNSGEEIIRPPAPEKGNKLMIALVVTAGALAAAVVGVLIIAVTTGVFS